MDALPIDPILPDVVRALANEPHALVIEAPPGAGKTTRVPRALLDHGALDGDIVVLEPRRLAARLAARRVASELNEDVGGTVGYQVRFERVASKRTRIHFVTEGVLTRRLLSDPELRGTSAVVLDELHERHIHADVALALLSRLKRTRRPELRIVAMSATLEVKPVADYLGCPILRAEGRRFDVAIDHLPAPDDRKLELQVASALRSLVNNGLAGDVLIFLPGAGEIRRAMDACASIVDAANLLALPLHGDLPPVDQDRAIAKNERKKVIFSTNVAESSVTIDGVVCVIDAGLVRVAGHAAWSGLPILRVIKTSKASAIQRAGRAGRTAPGRCVRLYTKGDFDARPEHDVPEILRVDLAETLLEIRASGVRDLAWLEAPPEAAVASATELLTRLGALDANGDVTDVGRRLLRFPIHPRLARLIVEGETRGVAEDACAAAALIGERDVRLSSRTRFDGPRSHDIAAERSDVIAMLDLFHEAEGASFSPHALRAIGLDHGAVQRVVRAKRQLTSECDRSAARPHDPAAVDRALQIAVLAAFPDRVAKRKRARSREIAMAGGGLAELAETSAVRDAEWLCAIDAELHGADARGKSRGITVRTASAIEPEWLLDLFIDRVREISELSWNATAERVDGHTRMTYDGLALDESSRLDPNDPAVAEALATAALAKGPRAFAAEGELDRWLARMRFAEKQDSRVVAPTDADIARSLRELSRGKRTFAELRDANLFAHLALAFPAPRLAEIAPDRITLASSRTARIEYEDGKPPWLESYLQDFFGTKSVPRAGTVPIVLHLLAPNKRAVQVTTDLAGFWSRHYPAIRKELARKYPKHAWPEDTSVPIPAKHGMRRG